MARTAVLLTPTELAIVQALDALAVSGAAQAIRKSSASTLANVNLAAGGGTAVWSETPAGAINGSNTSFTLANTPDSGTLRLYLNGLRLKAGVGQDFTLSGLTITMLYAPETGSNLLADYIYT